MDKTEIRQQIRLLAHERRKFMSEAMKEYDKEHYKKIKELRDRCEETGHQQGNFHDNGIGWTWFYCNCCGKAFDKEQYDI